MRQVITRAPLRVSFFGGGSDYPWYFTESEGLCLSVAIDKYVFVSVKTHEPAFGEAFRISYSETESVGQLAEIKNDVIRGALEMMEITQPLQVTTWADFPSGTGLGSSSAVAVALLNALSVFKGDSRSSGEIAQMASRLELDHLGRTMGLQDQYASAIGGFNALSFSSHGVSIKPIFVSEKAEKLFQGFRLIWTGLRRDASKEGEKASVEIPILSKRLAVDNLVSQARSGLAKISANELDLEEFGHLLNLAWEAKKKNLSIQHPEIDNVYQTCLKLGAYGGKLLGAGGGGFFLIAASRESLRAIDKNFRSRSIKFSISRTGSEVLYEQR